ncbi:MAG TPA: NAD-dependent epimerase/dehydratase family protein [Xanthobacteraceae bacterium]|nr:NAD-dependent epimerase/dehydratase family protein [Xanthobacteraceae bacterium]
MTRVLVTGATGFCGRPLVAKLLDAGYAVRAAVRGTPSPPFAPAVEIVDADLATPIDWVPLLAGVDAVVHLAAIAHARARIPDARYDAINHQATAALGQAAHAAGVQHVVFLSSVRAQSGSAADRVLTERMKPAPTDAYGRSKLAAEAALAASGVPFTILRPVLIYGPGLKGNLRALARLAALPLPLPLGGLTNRRSLLGIDNLVGAILLVLQTPTTRGETYLVADPQPITFADIVAAFRAANGRPPGLFGFPPRLIEISARVAGGSDLWDRIGGELVVYPGKLIAAGWMPARDTIAALTAAARPQPPSS